MDSSTVKPEKGFKIHDTIRRKLYEFPPPSEHPEVSIYLCGLTTYDYAHLGNMRGPILFDVFRKFLREIGYKVTFVTNFTDIDDKVIRRAEEKGEDPFHMSRKFSREYMKDLSALGIEHADIYPKVTYHIDDIIAYVQKIIDQGYGYESNGNVYFDVPKFNAETKAYGRLSRRNIDEMVTESRTDFDENKHNELDFALWKKDEKYGWDSPWGKGRPGWHIECSLMSTKYLGETFDIHSGAIDLKFPHHENEVAQAHAHSGPDTFARAWMHYEFINWKGGKLAKSGESFAVRDLFRKYHPEIIRQFVLSAKYRSPVEYSDEKMDEIKKSRARIDNFLFEARRLLGEGIEESRDNLKNELEAKNAKGLLGDTEKTALDEIDSMSERFLDDLRDDFNTQGAFSHIFETVNAANMLMTSGELSDSGKEIINLAYLHVLWAGSIFGLFKDEMNWLMTISDAQTLLGKKSGSGTLLHDVQTLVDLRTKLKSERKFAEADGVRAKIESLGYELRDTPEGPVLKPKE